MCGGVCASASVCVYECVCVCVGLLGSPSIELRNISLMTQDGTAVGEHSHDQCS